MKRYLEFKDSYSATAVDQLSEWVKNNQDVDFKVVNYTVDTELCSRILVEVEESQDDLLALMYHTNQLGDKVNNSSNNGQG